MNITEIVEQAKDLGYQIRHHKGLSILRTTNKVSVHQVDGLDLKGMIYRTSDTGKHLMVAPGCKVPLDKKPDCEPLYATQAHDGIMLRLFYHDDIWDLATTGSIDVNVKWGSKRSFLDMFNDAVKQLDTDFMDPNCCYYLVMEHEDHVNIVKHIGVRLTLTRVVRVRSFGVQEEPVYMYHGAFAHADQRIKIEDIDMNRGIGYMLHYEDGSVYRDSSTLYKRAAEIRPNLATEKERWFYLYQKEPGNLEEYLQLFPWVADEHRDYLSQLDSLKERINADYHAHCSGGNVWFPKRNVRFMHDLIRELPKDGSGDVEEFLMQQDLRRVLFMLDTEETVE